MSKLQKEQDKNKYSEEEVLNLLKKAHFVEQNIEEWFNQYKKINRGIKTPNEVSW